MRFFETNSLGRIINRFSRDLSFMEDQLPFFFAEFTQVRQDQDFKLGGGRGEYPPVRMLKPINAILPYHILLMYMYSI